MLEWMWILLIFIAVIGVIANASRQNSDAKTINRLRQNQRDDRTTYYDNNGRPIN